MRRKPRNDQPDLFSPRCPCGAYLIPTPSGYLACPEGHGGLTLEEEIEAEPCGLWFEEPSEFDDLPNGG